MKVEYIEVGQIVNTHGVRGELKVQPWCDSAEQFCEIKTLYLDGNPVKPLTRRVHKGSVLITLPGITDMDGALHCKNKVLSAKREDIPLPEGRYLNADLIGLSVRNCETGEVIGTVKDVLIYPANNVLVVRGEKEYLIPAVPPIIQTVNVEDGIMTIQVLKGMATDEN